jgi:hypothetical protein
MSVFQKWTCVFPGKMGLSWKRAWDGVGSKEEAEAQAAKNCNVVAVPLQLFETMKEHERRMVIAERPLNALVAALRGLLAEPTITETIRSAEARDMAFAANVPKYAADCDSIEAAAKIARAALALVVGGQEPAP